MSQPSARPELQAVGYYMVGISKLPGFDISDYPHIERLVTRMCERESVRHVLHVHAEAKRERH